MKLCIYNYIAAPPPAPPLQVKFGVRRERVPFVLAHDFEIIIEKHFGFEK